MNVTQANVAGADVVQAGDGPDLLLLHSLLAERSVFDRALPDLASDYRVTLPNLPGYGGTPPLALEDPTVADYADHIAGVMDGLDLPADTAVLGNGAGGFMAVALAIRHGGRLGKLVFADTGPGFPDAAKAPLRMLADRVEEVGMEAVLDAAMARMFPEPYIEANPEVIAERKAALAGCQPKAFAATARALANVEMADQIGAITNPTMVMVGLEDATTPPAMSYALHEGIAGSSLVEIPDCGHCPQIQARDTFVSELKAFLSG
ncbi:MAG: alpha/beta fold hydrolase [Alphaproteobacteria bacterium]|nr:alpha/beta fold hydrolase [Alphaproteobacteria bacterium]